MSIIDVLMGVLAPYECLGCGAEGRLLCRFCLPSAPGAAVCYRCLRPSDGSITCRECFVSGSLWRVRAAAEYGGLAKQLVSRLKFSGAQSAARTMAALMPRPDLSEADTLVVPVPTAAARARGRGFDQATLLAREFSARHRLKYSPCLARAGDTRQLGMARHERLNQLKGAFRVRNSGYARGRRVVLIDDVVTTGATLEAAARALNAEGVRRVEAVTFARVS